MQPERSRRERTGPGFHGRGAQMPCSVHWDSQTRTVPALLRSVAELDGRDGGLAMRIWEFHRNCGY